MFDRYVILISCVNTEMVMVSSPSIFYKADEVHLFRYIRDPGTASAMLYEDHFQSVCWQIRSSLPECLVTEHTDDPVYDLPRMVRALSVLYSRIRREHPDAEVHANLSSGPSEFKERVLLFEKLFTNILRAIRRIILSSRIFNFSSSQHSNSLVNPVVFGHSFKKKKIDKFLTFVEPLKITLVEMASARLSKPDCVF